jgi:hypothetical protein
VVLSWFFRKGVWEWGEEVCEEVLRFVGGLGGRVLIVLCVLGWR